MREYFLIFGSLQMLFPFKKWKYNNNVISFLKREINLNDLTTGQLHYRAVLESFKKDFFVLTLNAPIATKVVCFSRLLKCLSSLYGKQCGLRSDCSYRSSLFLVHAVCFYT